MRTWTLPAEDFAALWFGPANDRMPFPFRFLSRFALADEYEAHRTKTRDTFSADRFEDLHHALHIIAEPRARIEVYGRRGEREELRILGCIDGRPGVVASQRRGGDITLQLVSAEKVAGLVVDRLPEAGPGSKRVQRFATSALADDAPFVMRTDGVSEKARYAKIVNAPRASEGTLSVYAGPRHGDQRVTGTVRWYDLVGDGRYLETRTRDTIEVKPAALNDILARIHKALKASEMH
ncbi:ESX secretion-associated protein EspG [Antrihabitans stalactiti]|uniref:ESX secretion-associated protein EspG n=1 Tax=Antrihabitans stalactiti TaxID=2584121 RepID=UPI00146D93C8|nr:ESX secretion-associated protein EspG [Antrihabitans stalactiti]